MDKQILRILSFNIRNSEARDGKNRWKKRKEIVIDVIQKANPDIIGFQEVLPNQFQFLQENLPDYVCYGLGRDDGKHKGERSPIFAKNGKITQESSFWLSDTPEIPSHSWSQMARIVTTCEFVSNQFNQPILIANTHFPLPEEARLKAATLILERIGNSHPLILMGDFNFAPFSLEYLKLSENFIDAWQQTHQKEDHQITFHEFTGKTHFEPNKPGLDRIDFFWLSPNLNIIKCEILTEFHSNKKGRYPSDHWPINLEVEINPLDKG